MMMGFGVDVGVGVGKIHVNTTSAVRFVPWTVALTVTRADRTLSVVRATPLTVVALAGSTELARVEDAAATASMAWNCTTLGLAGLPLASVNSAVTRG
jgi:hypothetical protein